MSQNDLDLQHHQLEMERCVLQERMLKLQEEMLKLDQRDAALRKERSQAEINKLKGV